MSKDSQKTSTKKIKYISKQKRSGISTHYVRVSDIQTIDLLNGVLQLNGIDPINHSIIGTYSKDKLNERYCHGSFPYWIPENLYNLVKSLEDIDEEYMDKE